MRVDRIEKMERYIAEHKSASVDELCEVFNISKNTVRRDLKEILANSDYKKTYGGVCVTRSYLPLPFTERFNSNTDIKRRLAQRAAQEVCNGDIIYIDSGTTTCHIVDALPDVDNITIITHSLEVVNRAIARPKLTVLLLPGMVNRKTLSLVCPKPMEQMRDYNIGKAFMAADGLTVANGATQFTASEYEIKSAVISRSNKVYLLIENEKFEQASLYTYCNLDRIDHVITDKAPSDNFQHTLESCGGKLHVV